MTATTFSHSTNRLSLLDLKLPQPPRPAGCQCRCQRSGRAGSFIKRGAIPRPDFAANDRTVTRTIHHFQQHQKQFRERWPWIGTHLYHRHAVHLSPAYHFNNFHRHFHLQNHYRQRYMGTNILRELCSMYCLGVANDGKRNDRLFRKCFCPLLTSTNRPQFFLPVSTTLILNALQLTFVTKVPTSTNKFHF